MKRENSKGNEEERTPGEEGELSEDFQKFLKDQELASRAWAMVDAVLEVDPDADPDKTFQEAIQWINEHSEDSEGESTNDRH